LVYDLIIIGGGPAGYLAAERAGHEGFATLLIEKREVGGVCLNEGCVPTKTLLYSAKLKDGAAHGEKYGVHASGVTIDQKEVVARKNKVVGMLVGGVKAALKAAHIETVAGEAIITGRNDEGYTVKSGETVYTGKRLLIATGSVPVVSPIPGLKDAVAAGFALTNREILDLTEVPKKLVVIGGGVIGLEMASYFKSAGAEVTVVEMLDMIGGAIDAEIAALLKRNYEKKGVKFLLGCKVTEVLKDGVAFETKDGKKETVPADKILLSIGRRAFTEGLGLETIGVETERGAVKTDERMKTNVPEVYAAGDVNGRSMLAHTAYREAEAAVNNMAGKKDIMRYNAIPGVIYTNPEVAGVGETESSAKSKGLDVTVKTLSMRYSGRYVAENEGGDGIVKLIVDNRKKTLLGVHMIGNYASEIIYGACMMVEREMTIESIKKAVFPHPTVSEIIREAIFSL
jgi:dihydrolipoamide dehydrogenase